VGTLDIFVGANNSFSEIGYGRASLYLVGTDVYCLGEVKSILDDLDHSKKIEGFGVC
jgi:hypothetical protein